MAHKHKKYNCTVCMFCPHRATCSSLLDAIHCGDCKHTIQCAQSEGPGLQDCGRAKAAWVAAGLPCKCLLSSQVLADPPEGLFISLPGVEDSADEVKNELISCPRCACERAMITTSYTWTPEQRMRTQRDIKCGVCKLDAQETFE